MNPSPQSAEDGKGFKVVTADWMPKNSVMFVVNGVEALVRHDLTDKVGKATIKQPKAVLVTNIKGESAFMKVMRKLWRTR